MFVCEQLANTQLQSHGSPWRAHTHSSSAIDNMRVA